MRSIDEPLKLHIIEMPVVVEHKSNMSQFEDDNEKKREARGDREMKGRRRIGSEVRRERRVERV